jgi:ABC-type uncharacterized transport system involved in gliding motility auxiliary subunit
METNSLILVCMALTLISGLVCGLTAYLVPHIPLLWQVSGVLAILFLAAYLALDRKSLGQLFSKKTTRYGLNALAMSILALGIAIFANLIANEHDLKKDFTKNQSHSLSEQSVKVLKNLKEEVTIKAFIDPRSKQEFQDVFDRYSYQTKMVKVEFLDLDKDPRVLEKYKIKKGDAIIVESANRSSRIDNLTGPEDAKLEEKLTNALIQVAKGDKKKIYFVSGHGERIPSDTGREGMSKIKQTLEESRYSVQELALMQVDKIPADADIVVDGGPRSQYVASELKNLEDYVWSGGKLLMMVDPNSPTDLKGFLAGFGANWTPKKTVFEANPLQKLAGGNPLLPLINGYDPTSEITRDLKQFSLFSIPTPIEKSATVPPGMKVTTLFSTSSRSLEVELQGEKVKIDEKTDRRGPLSLALSIEGTGKAPAAKPDPKDKDAAAKKDEPAKAPEFRMVVVGGSSFATNGFIDTGMNSDLFQNMLAWLAHDEDLISIRPKPTDVREFEVSETQVRVIYLASVFFLPLMMLASGLGVWMTRRRK